MTALLAPAVPSPVRLIRRPRHSVWPYAGVVSAAGAVATVVFGAQGPDTFTHDATPSTASILSHLNSEAVIRAGAGFGLVSAVSALVFLVGLARFVASFVGPDSSLVTALRWSSVALVATTSLGAAVHYVAASGHPGSVDRSAYTREASATVAVLADQLACAAYLPALVIMAVVGVLVLRHRLLNRLTGVAALLLATGSTAATLALGLPYSAALVYPLFALAVAAGAVASRKAS